MERLAHTARMSYEAGWVISIMDVKNTFHEMKRAHIREQLDTV